MNTKLLGAFLLMASMSGCIVVGGGGGGGTKPPPAQPGDVTFTWSFSGMTCADVPDVKSVRIEIPGETLQNDGIYPCSANNYPGIVLHDFAAGSYPFTMTALSWTNEALFAGSGNFAVNGNTRVTIDLTPVGGPTSYAYLQWRFPANSVSTNPTCDQAGVTFVDVSIDGSSEWVRYNCADGTTAQGTPTGYLNPGMHTITLLGVNADGYGYYRYDGQLQTLAGNPVAAQYNLNWDVGGAKIGWTLTNATVSQTCAQAGVTTVYVNFQDANGDMVYPNYGDAQPCNASPAKYNYLKPGTYWVYVQAFGTNNTPYYSNTTNPPQVTVTAGTFVDDNSQSLVLTMFKQ